MKIILKYIFLLLGAMALLGSCKKSDVGVYGDTDDVYFDWYTSYVWTRDRAYDTLKVNYALKGSAVRESVPFYVKLLGKTTGKNRAFNLVVDESQSTAVAGKDYILPNAEDLVLQADSNSRKLKVEILRREDLRDKTFRLVFKLLPNENFQIDPGLFVGDPTKKVKSGGEIMEILIQDVLPKPELWDKNVNLFGTFSRKKLELFAQVQLLDLANFYNSQLILPYSVSILQSNAKLFQKYLNKNKLAGNTILDEDSTEMKMGIDVQ